jgi:TP901 family phage tail tape measure protein
MEGLNFDVGLNTSGFNSGIGNMTSSLNNLADTATEVGGMIAAALGVATIGKAIQDSIDKFQEFETGLTEVSTLISGEMQPTIEKYGESVERIMKSTGDSAGESTSAVYNFVSAFGDLDDATMILDVASKQAVAGVTNTQTAINFLASTIFGFGVPATEEMAKKMADLGQMTVRQARTTLPELEAAIGKSTATAAALSVSAEEYFANFAAGTKIIGNAAETGTAFKMVLSNMTKPTNEMAEAISGYATEIGLADDATAKAIFSNVGFTEGLRGIVRQSGGSAEMLSKMFGSVEALNLAMALTGPLTEEVDKNLEAMSESTGSVDEAYEKMAGTSEMAYKQMKAQAEIFTSTFGDLFDSVTRPMVEDFTGVMEGWTDRLKTFTQGFKDWQAELAKDDSFGGELLKSLSGAAPLTVPIMFAVSAAQKGLGSMLQNIGGFGEGLKAAGGKIVGAAGTAALSLGIAIAINDIQQGEDLKKVGIQQAIGAALGLGAGMIGGAAVGQMVYGITVAITDVILTKSPEEYFKDLQGEAMKSIELVTSAEPSQKTKDNYIEQYKKLSDLTRNVIGSEDYEIRLSTDQKTVLNQVDEYVQILGEELKKDPVEMDLSKIKQQFAEIDFLLLGMSEGIVSSVDEGKYLDQIFTMREKLLGETISVTEQLSAKFDYITAQSFDEYAYQYSEIVRASMKAVNDALKEDPENLETTIGNIKEMTKSALESLDVTDFDMTNAMDVLEKQITEAMGNVSKAVNEQGIEEIEIKINTKSMIEQLQTAINSTNFEQVYDLDDFVKQVKSLDFENTVGLKPDDSEIKAAILALDMTPVKLLLQPDTSAISSFIDQLKIEMGVSGGSEEPAGEEKAMGGYTASVGRNTPAGIVHGGEWVAPAWMVQDSKFSKAIESLEQARNNRGYAQGGQVMPQQNMQPTLVFNFNGQLIQDDPESKRKIAEWVHESFEEAGVRA